MKKNNLIIGFNIAILLFVCTLSANAQKKKMDMADYEKRKVEYITKEADLSKEEAVKYFPIYNELFKKKFELHRQHRDKVEKMKASKSNMSNEEYRKLLENDMEVKLKEAELDKVYSTRLEKVLSPEKLYRAQQAEKKFMQLELQKFRENE